MPSRCIVRCLQMMRSAAVYFLFLAMWTSGCSLLVSFPPQGRPCTETGECLDGYSCVDLKCIQHHTLLIGEGCNTSEVCANGLVCGEGMCRFPCTNVYGQSAECDSDQICARTHDAEGVAFAACIPDSCASPCPNFSASCAEINAGQTLCVADCTVNCLGSTCIDSCHTYDQVCQPQGDLQVFACNERGEQGHGEPCNFKDLLCDDGTACIKQSDQETGTCLAYCDPTAPLSCLNLLDPLTGATAECRLQGNFGVCGRIALSDQDTSALPTSNSALVCVEHCDSDGDCLDGFSCVDDKCQRDECSSDIECLSSVSGWTTSCTSNRFCSAAANEVCIDTPLGGRCARVPSSTIPCSSLGLTTLTGRNFFNSVDGSSTVSVCGIEGYVCTDGSCQNPCDSDTECSTRALGSRTPKCNATTHQCVCQTDAQCATGGGTLTRCKNGNCVCRTGSECADQGFSECRDGVCSCADDGECESSSSGHLCTQNPACGCDTQADCGGTLNHPSTNWACASP